VDQRRLAAAHRRHQGQFVVRGQHDVCIRVLAVHSHHDGNTRRYLGEGIQRVLHARALRELQGQLASARAFAQYREQLHRYLHDL
jgi:hypothetical protein